MTEVREIEEDLDWREAEMAVLRIFLANKDISDRERLVLFRAGWALLYAHYEGFCKFALTVYYDALQKKALPSKDLPKKTQAFALSNSLKNMRSLPTIELIAKIRNFEQDVMDKPAVFPEVDTESNLWPNTLSLLLESANIACESLTDHSRTLGMLVSRRNKIAHGERDIIPEYSYYVRVEDAVRVVMLDLALAIAEKLES